MYNNQWKIEFLEDQLYDKNEALCSQHSSIVDMADYINDLCDMLSFLIKDLDECNELRDEVEDLIDNAQGFACTCVEESEGYV